MDKIVKAIKRMASVVTDSKGEDGDFWNAFDAYRDKFKESPTVVGLMDMKPKMAEVLREAVKNGKSLSDAEWYKAIGVKAPHPGALV